MSITVNPECYRCCFPSLAAIAIGLTILVLAGAILLGLTIFNLNSFLTKNDPVATDVLIVEGWLPDYAIAAAIVEFQNGKYKTLITVGAPLPRGFYLSEYKTFAELAGATAIALGFNPAQLQVVSTTATPEGRTQNGAMAIEQHFANSDALPIQSMNVFTLGPHARRTQLVFRKVFPAPTQVGIIGTTILAYDERNWWRSSEGVRTVVAEAIAYLYQLGWG